MTQRYELRRLLALCALLLGAVLALHFSALAPVAEAQSGTPGGPTCPLESMRGRSPHLVAGPPPQEFLSLLGVLRRPITAADRPTDLRDIFLARIKKDYVRLLGTGPHGERYYLVPGYERPVGFSASCKRRLPPSQRRVHERFERDVRARAREPALFLHEIGRDSGSTSLLSAEAIKASSVSIGCTDHACRRPFRSTVVSVVPDPVASVTLTFRGGLVRTLSTPTNFWAIEVPLDIDRSAPIRTVWRGPDGEAIREFDDAGP